MTANGIDTAKQWKAAGSSEKAIKLFKHTANSFSVLGPDAWHGQTRHQPPANPMTLDEAAKIVRRRQHLRECADPAGHGEAG